MPAGVRPGRRCSVCCGRWTACSAPTVRTPSSPGWVAARSASRRARPEVAEVLDLGQQAERESWGTFAVRRPAADKTMVLDPSGVVKGWAVERAAAHLHELADTDFSLSAGGDLLCHTADPDTAPWRIGIEDPHDPRRLIATVPVHRGAVATSGTAHRGSHLVDARTGEPPVGVASVTVVAPSLTWADIDATAAYGHGPAAVEWLRTRPGRSGLVVWADRSTAVFGGLA